MSPACPAALEWSRLLDGEVTENRGAELRGHLLECRRCALELESQRQLVERLSAPIPGIPSSGAVREVMRHLDSEPAPARQSRAARWWALGAGGVAAAAAVVLAVSVLPRTGGEPEGFRARGTVAAWVETVGVELWGVETPPRSLAMGTSVQPGAAVVAAYRNAGPGPAYLLAFAVDAVGEVRWLYPGFTDPATDPAATPLEPAAARQVLPESVAFDGVVPGPLRVVSIVSREPLRVSSIESLPAAERTLAALRARWPAARIEEVVLHVEGARP